MNASTWPASAIRSSDSLWAQARQDQPRPTQVRMQHAILAREALHEERIDALQAVVFHTIKKLSRMLRWGLLR